VALDGTGDARPSGSSFSSLIEDDGRFLFGSVT